MPIQNVNSCWLGTVRDPCGLRGSLPFDPSGCCEMNRLYVTPEDRGLGLGKTLVNDVATAPAYQEIRLDTLPSM